MKIQEKIKQLTEKEKFDLAAKLTQAAMSNIAPKSTLQGDAALVYISFQTYKVFCNTLNLLETCPDFPPLPTIEDVEKILNDFSVTPLGN